MNDGVKRTLERVEKFKSILAIEGLLVGVVAGLVVVVYRLCLSYASTWLKQMIAWANGNLFNILLWFVILILLAYIVARLLKWEPLISGSGIPQLEGELQEKLNTTWWRVLLAKFVGGFLCLFAGLSLGREGPSIQLGAMSAKGISRSLRRSKSEERYLLTCGASAGLSAAFHAPLAGVMFALEEVHKHFTPALLISAMCASIGADYLMSNILGMHPVFSFDLLSSLPQKYYGFLIVLGVILGVCGVIYNAGLLYIQNLYRKAKKLSPFVKLLIPFLLSGVIAFTLPDILGGGDGLVEKLIAGKYSLNLLLILFISKFLFSAICFGSGAPGGIFFPLLVMGCLIGGIYANLVVAFFDVDPAFINNFILLSMAGFFTAIVRAPMTGIILIFEMTGSLTHLFAISLITIVAYIVADLLKSAPIYDSLLENLLANNKEIEVTPIKQKVLLEFMVTYHSELNGKKVMEVDWPNCLLVALKRGEKEFIPKGNTKIQAQDVLITMSDEKESANVYDRMSELCDSSML
ncbi:MAG: ClC family H(+)/Cl(-) exchange transporter [Erysipelotrichia bacterium]|nr:ClC family H(+)/Cl(-) exchange transporter [Erysipelotrichia bacterium]